MAGRSHADGLPPATPLAPVRSVPNPPTAESSCGVCGRVRAVLRGELAVCGGSERATIADGWLEVRRVRLRVLSDGTLAGTKVVNAETGELVEGVLAVEWSMDAEALTTRLVVTLDKAPVEIEDVVIDTKDE